MTNFQLKLIALLTMTIDHIGYIFGTAIFGIYYEPLRIIGRLSFVLFAFLITEGLKHTKNKERYIATLFIFAFIIDIPRLFLGFDYLTNIFYTLGLGALALYLLTHFKHIVLQIVAVIAMLFFAEAIAADYGAFGVMLIVSIEIARRFTDDTRIMREFVMMGFYYILVTAFSMHSIQIYGIFAFFIIMLYNGKQGYYHPILKYLVYIYYPLHLIIIYFYLITQI